MPGKFNEPKFNQTQFNGSGVVIFAQDSAEVVETVVSTVLVEEPVVLSEEANIVQGSADFASVSEAADFITNVISSDSMLASEVAFALTVLTTELVTQSNTTIITATQPAADSATLSEAAIVIISVSHSSVLSEATSFPVQASDSAVMSEAVSLTFAIGSVNATLVTQTALGTPAGVGIRTTPVLSSVVGVFFVPQSQSNNTNGTAVISVSAGIRMLYEIKLSDLNYRSLVTQAINTNTNVGTAARLSAGQLIGSQTLKTITGNILNLFGLPSQSLLIRMNRTAIDRAGTFRTEELVELPTGAISISLPATADLYSPSGGTVLYEIVQDKPNFPRVGKFGFTVPSGAGPFTFAVVSGSIVVI